jgi:hypothetical protein
MAKWYKVCLAPSLIQTQWRLKKKKRGHGFPIGSWPCVKRPWDQFPTPQKPKPKPRYEFHTGHISSPSSGGTSFFFLFPVRI